MEFPWSTVCINVLGCFVIGFFGTLTLAAGRYPVPENVRMFVMVGVGGGFTTWGRALMNVVLSVVICFFAVALGHYVAERITGNVAIAQTEEEELTG